MSFDNLFSARAFHFDLKNYQFSHVFNSKLQHPMEKKVVQHQKPKN